MGKCPPDREYGVLYELLVEESEANSPHALTWRTEAWLTGTCIALRLAILSDLHKRGAAMEDCIC